MMNYEIFKEVVKEKFMDYMPEKFKGMELVAEPVEKVNVTLDGIDSDGKMYRQDIAEENGEIEPYLIDDVIDIVCEWNYELMWCRDFRLREV